MLGLLVGVMFIDYGGQNDVQAKVYINQRWQEKHWSQRVLTLIVCLLKWLAVVCIDGVSNEI